MIVVPDCSVLIIEADDAARVPLKSLQACDIALRIEPDGRVVVLKDSQGVLPLAMPREF